MGRYQGEPKRVEPLNSKLYSAGVWKEFCLTYAGSLLSGIEMGGTDPTALGEHDRRLFSSVQRALYQSLHPSLSLCQYYFHFEGKEVALRERDDPRSDLLSKRRARFLNSQRLNDSRLFWLLECPAEEHVNNLLSVGMLKHLFQAPFEAESRLLLMQRFRNHDAWIAEERQLQRQADLLEASLKDLSSRAELVSPRSSSMNLQSLWALHRALVNMNPSLLDSAVHEEVPVENWDALLSNGGIEPVEIDGMTCLKFHGPRPVYARVASIIAYGGRYVPEGIWIQTQRSPLMQKGNYLVVNRWVPYSKAGLSMLLRNKANELARQNMKLSAILTGENPNSGMEEKLKNSDHLRKKVKELDDAANTPDRWGSYNSHVVVWNENPLELKSACAEMHTALTESSLTAVWESAGLIELFPTLLPGYAKKSMRAVEFTSSQAGATSIAFKSQKGVTSWGPAKEEPTYILQTRDNCAFGYSEFLADKGLVIATGPTRSGKTFAKNSIASHFMKFGGLYQDIGVDAGAEAMAAFFGSDAGVFRITDPATSHGFNAFFSADPALKEKDGLFVGHLLHLLRIMFELNESADLRSIDKDEQADLDRAIRDILRVDEASMRTLSGLYSHFPKSLKQKLERWVRPGIYGNLFDNEIDGLGTFGRRMGIYNLSGLKDDHRLAALAQTEIFFRVTRLFEDPKLVDRIKQLQIDECQYFLDVPGAVQFLLAKVRTWNKWNAGITLWTQSPQHYAAIPDWQMLRGAATTFLFGAEPKMSTEMRSHYKTVFGASDGIVDGIESLRPQREMLIWQPEADIAQVVQLNVEPEQYVVSTSSPSEQPVIREMFAKYPGDVDRAIAEAVKALRLA
ncbi:MULTISPECIES: VirB4 family type IV secretion system protein [Pseudomonas]|uniref:VirB4 family type IV secretion system protein n=1 Tax=Pseudomonas TaxID=286 RepID=UPI00071C3BBA|nr:VirB4 family type IV secretion system protein [Pseudomonas aeruginosa]EIU3538698.1 hypothetical protein [Pseudomonas aeruginosa]EKU5195777.1 hypothetical protein [Pseudomonas aeruginosa]EKX2591918.1 hypothetical protein [Pseudomonas aeruginosa]EKY4163846.1 hypothetical protein [Pseudomonas aeruginosa]ELH4079706.1 hypothetical protein [Pseudomonas aeruginosa]